MRVAVGNDHRGYRVKEKLIRLLGQLGHEVEDNGSNDDQPVDYPDVASVVARKVASGEVDRGILICGTGIGMCIAANKICGVLAALCQDDLTAEISRRHNNTNVLCLSADMLGGRDVDRLIKIWLDTEFGGGRHARRVAKIAELDHHRQSGEDTDNRPGDHGG